MAQVVDDTKLYDRHVSYLTQILCTYANKWRMLGTALHFTPDELSNIEGKPKLFTGAPASYLQEMLSQWVQWPTYSHPDSCATIGELETALRSQLVGLGVVAENLKSELEKNSGSLVRPQTQLLPAQGQHSATGPGNHEPPNPTNIPYTSISSSEISITSTPRNPRSQTNPPASDLRSQQPASRDVPRTTISSSEISITRGPTSQSNPPDHDSDLHSQPPESRDAAPHTTISYTGISITGNPVDPVSDSDSPSHSRDVPHTTISSSGIRITGNPTSQNSSRDSDSNNGDAPHTTISYTGIRISGNPTSQPAPSSNPPTNGDVVRTTISASGICITGSRTDL